jgi:hypothetical protein
VLRVCVRVNLCPCIYKEYVQRVMCAPACSAMLANVWHRGDSRQNDVGGVNEHFVHIHVCTSAIIQQNAIPAGAGEGVGAT